MMAKPIASAHPIATDTPCTSHCAARAVCPVCARRLYLRPCAGGSPPLHGSGFASCTSPCRTIIFISW
jgi:hypothetical protein